MSTSESTASKFKHIKSILILVVPTHNVCPFLLVEEVETALEERPSSYLTHVADYVRLELAVSFSLSHLLLPLEC